jgi:16S rRNA G966 N2-methylase RsmD
MDPPYGQQLLTPVLRAVAASGILAEGGTVVAEGHWRDRPEAIPGLVVRREARYGETALWYLERAGGERA